MAKRKRQLSLICVFHYVKLVFRAMLLALATVIYVISRVHHEKLMEIEVVKRFGKEFWALAIIWVVYAIEMALRFFPSKIESMGCQKQFKRNYMPTGETVPLLHSWKRTFAVAAVWIGLNAVFATLYFIGIFDAGIMILISLFYGVCDMVCILFFCPFQTWIMKNRCCTVCRIYNWDFAMMFTPLVVIVSPYTWGLVALSIALLLRWEITLRIHPERFAENTNGCMSCKNCNEKLCQYKTQLRKFIKQDLKEKLKKINSPKN